MPTFDASDIYDRVREIVARELGEVVGVPAPDQKAVEAAVLMALGIPGRNAENCILSSVYAFIVAMDKAPWSSFTSEKAIARIVIAQWGMADTLDVSLIGERLRKTVISQLLPGVFTSVAGLFQGSVRSKLLIAAERCQTEGSAAAASAADLAASDVYRMASRGTEKSRASWAAASAAAYASADVSGNPPDLARCAGCAVKWAASASMHALQRQPEQILADFCEEVVKVLLELKTLAPCG